LEKRTILFKGREVRLLLESDKVRFEIEINGKPLTFLSLDDLERFITLKGAPTKEQLQEAVRHTTKIAMNYSQRSVLRAPDTMSEFQRALAFYYVMDAALEESGKL
jgi:hypothetical protein